MTIPRRLPVLRYRERGCYLRLFPTIGSEAALVAVPPRRGRQRGNLPTGGSAVSRRRARPVLFRLIASGVHL